jgi:uncharacterized membrane-anchored protein
MTSNKKSNIETETRNYSTKRNESEKPTSGEQENDQIEHQDLDVKMEADKQTIEISEKSDYLMYRAITFLKVGFWTVVVFAALAVFSALLHLGKNVLFGIIWLIFIGTVFRFLLVRMYDYIAAYKIFRKTKRKRALEELLDAQQSYYWWIYLLPIILIGLALVWFVLGGFLDW